MKAPELFRRMSPVLAGQILSYLHDTAKPTYKVAVQTLATQQRLRAVFVERKPRTERHVWLQRALSRPASEPVAANFIQLWLVGAQVPMLCDFLDALGLAHDEKGSIEDLPPSPPADKLVPAVDTLLSKYPPEPVIVYLYTFLEMDPVGWSALGELLVSDPRLQLPVAAAAAA